MFKKTINSIAAVIILFSCALAVAQSDMETYQAKIDRLNQQMKDVRDVYKSDMRQVDKDIMVRMKQLQPNDRVGRNKLLDQKRARKKKIQQTYQQTQQSIRSQVKALKAEQAAIAVKKAK